MERQFTTLTLGDAVFGIDILMMREINRNLDLTPVEQAPDYVRGLLNLRGQIVTILDLGARLGFGACTITPRSRCLVLKTSSELAVHHKAGLLDDDTSDDMVAVLVDSIGDMVDIDDQEIEPPPPNICGIDRKYLSGVIKLENTLIGTLKLREVLGASQQFGGEDWQGS